MGTGQTVLTIGALILLGLTIVSTNRSSLQHGVILQQTEIGVYAVSLAMGKIEEAAGKSFDEYTAPDATGATQAATAVTQFTAAGSLNRETGETYPDFDDIDDFNYYNTTPYVVYVPGVDSMKIRTTVNYINPSTPEVAATTQTWHKKITVYVTGTVTQDTVKMSYIYSYWWFR